MKLSRTTIAVITLSLFAGVAPVNAAPITIQYTGPTFTSLASSPSVPSLHPVGLTGVTATVTFATALVDLPNVNTGNNMAASVTSFTISDGVTTVTEATAGYDLFISLAALDAVALAAADFSKWSVGVSRPGSQHFGDTGNWNISTFFDPGFSIVDKSNYCLAVSATFGDCNVSFQAGAFTGGEWSIVDDSDPVVVSEPGALMLFTLGLVSLGFGRRRRRQIKRHA